MKWTKLKPWVVLLVSWLATGCQTTVASNICFGYCSCTNYVWPMCLLTSVIALGLYTLCIAFLYNFYRLTYTESWSPLVLGNILFFPSDFLGSSSKIFELFMTSCSSLSKDMLINTIRQICNNLGKSEVFGMASRYRADLVSWWAFGCLILVFLVYSKGHHAQMIFFI